MRTLQTRLSLEPIEGFPPMPSKIEGITVLIGVTVIVLLIGFAAAALLLWR
jgi:hypothetical protein